MPTINYFIGEEKTVVEETKDYASSIFHEQYGQALRLFHEMSFRPMTDIPNLIAFCGDRGEGKSSCMSSVRHIIDSYSDDVLTQRYVDQELGAQKIWNDKKIKVLPIIDPAFFDKNHNVLELLLAHFYSLFKEVANNNSESSYTDRNEVAKDFQKVKLHLRHLDKNKEELFDPLEELESLAAGINLQVSISSLMKQLLKFIKKDMFVICIDDLDLNMSEAYTMCEQIRKYLCNEHCVILVSVKIEQLLEAVQNAIHVEANYPNNLDIYSMATKYVTKLIPLASRVQMPKVYDLCEFRLNVYSCRGDEGKLIFDSPSVKEGIVRKIFYTTRYLFYNSKGSTSLIVPNNLRSLFQLLGLLFSMQEYAGGENTKSIHFFNKNLFKNYFYHLWSRQLSQNNQKIVERLITSSTLNDTNKFVVHHLIDYLPNEVKDEEVLKDIINPSNYSYNVSVGDVMYILSYLEHNTFDEELKKLLFFIKSYYSIRLYENYDEVTEKDGELYPVEDESAGGIYKSEAWFSRTNILQRCVAGRYFVYEADELLATKGSGATKESRDYRIIQGTNNGVTNLFTGIRTILNDNEIAASLRNDQSKTEKFHARFRLAEYFALSISTSIYQKETLKRIQVNRRKAQPYYLSKFNANTGYYIFDVLNIFYQMTNIQYAYDRFNGIAKLFDDAYKYEWSLLRQMIDVVRAKLQNDWPQKDHYLIPDVNEANKDFWLKKLASNSIIRNMEVMQSVLENIKSNRYTERNYSSSSELLAEFYKNIINTKMATYRQTQEKPAYSIEFDFLKPIVNLLKDDTISQTFEFGGVVLPSFEDIFIPVELENKWTEKDVYQLLPNVFKGISRLKGRTFIKRIHEFNEEIYSMYTESQWRDIFDINKTYTKSEAAEVLSSKYSEFKEAIDNKLSQSTVPSTPPAPPVFESHQPAEDPQSEAKSLDKEQKVAEDQ